MTDSDSFADDETVDLIASKKVEGTTVYSPAGESWAASTTSWSISDPFIVI